MRKFNPKKLSVKFKDGVTLSEPIINRQYTLTHSDITAQLFLTIGMQYDYEEITSMRDEVLGKWIKEDDKYYFDVYLQVDKNDNLIITSIRNNIFRRELPLALTAIRYGDREFFDAHYFLDYAPIRVYFKSDNPHFNKVENWGDFSKYKI